MEKSHSRDSFETDDNNSISDSSDSVTDLSPDGGWGWIVCFAAFVAFFILDGTMFAFGVLLIDLLEYFGDSKGKTAFVGSVLIGASLILGPVVGVLLDRYSCRQVTIAGTLIAVSGFVASIFSPNVEILIITYGFVGGIGFCMVYITSVIAVGIYFSRKRALATGIAISGAGIGIFAYGYLCDFLLSEYDWRGTVLILAGILLNCVLCGAVYRPIYSKTRVHSSNIEQTSPSKQEKSGYLLQNLISEKEGLLMDNKSGKSMFSFSSMPGLNMNLSEQATEDNHELYYDSLNSKRFLSSSNLFTANNQITTSYLKPMTRKDIFYSGSITNLRIGGGGGSRNLSSLLVSLTAKDTDSESCSSASSNSSTLLVPRPHWLRHLKHQLRLFKKPRFVILLVSCTLWTGNNC